LTYCLGFMIVEIKYVAYSQPVLFQTYCEYSSSSYVKQTWKYVHSHLESNFKFVLGKFYQHYMT